MGPVTEVEEEAGKEDEDEDEEEEKEAGRSLWVMSCTVSALPTQRQAASKALLPYRRSDSWTCSIARSRSSAIRRVTSLKLSCLLWKAGPGGGGRGPPTRLDMSPAS